jgi:uncharacterized repeat protein (TIGR01451 family)
MRESGRVAALRLTRIVALGLVLGSLAVTIPVTPGQPAPLVVADQGDSLRIDPSVVATLVGNGAEVTVANGPTVVLPFVNEGTAPVTVVDAGAAYNPGDFAEGTLVRDLLNANLYDLTGLDDESVLGLPGVFTVDGSGQLGCVGATLNPGQSCQVRVRVNAVWRAAGVSVSVDGLIDGGSESSTLGRTFVFWPTGTGWPDHDLISDAARLPGSEGTGGVWPNPVTPGVADTLPGIVGTTVDRDSFGDPDIAGSPASRAWWLLLQFPETGRVELAVQAIEGSGQPTPTGVRAQLFRVPQDAPAQPSADDLLPLGATASAEGGAGNLTVSGSVDGTSRYYLAVDDLGSATAFEITATFQLGGTPPPNDDLAGAVDLSGLTIPAFVADPSGLPVDVASVTGTTEGSTRETLEYGTVLNPDGAETPPPNGTVWYRFASPPDGFAGRLGYRVSQGFVVTPLVQRYGATGPPTPASSDVQFAPGNTWPPSHLSFARMEPGHVVWFQVQASLQNDAVGNDAWTDGGFTFDLYQVPNEQDDIADAYDVQGADRPDGSGGPWSDGFSWSGDGDTYHTTADQLDGPATMWFTATFDRGGYWSFTASSETAEGRGSTRPLGVRLYRAPTARRVSGPADLTPVTAANGSIVENDPRFGYTEPFWLTRLESVPVQPGRYYWSVDQGAAGPTFFGLQSRFVGDDRPPDVTPPTITITGITEGGTVTSTAEPTVTISSDEPLAVVDCTLDVTRYSDGSSFSNPVGCLGAGASEGEFTLPSLPDGLVTLTVVGSDAAGNTSTATLTFSVEVVPTASISSPVDGATYLSSEVPASVSYVCADNGVITTEELQLVPQGGGLPTLLVGSPPDTAGVHTVRVVCVDGLGAEATATATYTVVVPDRTPPETSIDSVTVTGRDVSVALSGTDDGGGPVSFQCAVSARVGWVPGSEVWRQCVSPVSYSNLVEGYYLVSVRATDGAGNVDASPAIRAFTVDVSPPQVTIFNPVDGSTFSPGEVVELQAQCTDLDIASFTFTVNGVPLVGTELPTTPGDYVVAARCVDQTGLETTRTVSYTVPAPDTTPPTITISGIVEGGTVTSTAEPSVTITSDEPLAVVDCTLDIVRDDDGPDSSNPIGCDVGSLALPELPDGTVTLTVFGEDAAGNATTVTRSFFVSVPPTVTITAPADGATYTSLAVPALAYTCADNDGAATFLEAQLLTPSGWVLLEGPPPSTPGTHTIAVLCEDAVANEGRAETTYIVSNPTIIDVRTVDADGTLVVGACYAIDIRLGILPSSEITRTCDAATGANADGTADGVARFLDGRGGQGFYFLRNVSLPPLRYPIPDRSLLDVPVQQTTTITINTYRCANTCLRVQPRLADGTEPTLPLRPLGVPSDPVQPLPATPPFPTAFVIPDLTPGVTTDIPVVADDFGRAPLEVGRIRFTPAAGLNALDPLTILPAHTISANLQRPDGLPLADGGACLQLRGVSPVRSARVACTERGSSALQWRALPGFYVVEVAAGTALPAGLLAPVLPANVPETQSEQTLDLTFRTSQGGTVTVAPLNFQLAPIVQLPAVSPPACEIGLFLLVGGTQATAPTATACFGSGPNPAPAVMVVPAGTYVVTRTSAWNVPGLTTGSNLVTVGAGESVSTDLTLFDPSTAGDAPTARDDSATARPGAGVTVAVLANDTDPTGQPLTTEIVTPPAQGTASATGDGRIAYLASGTAVGTDTVRYAAVDPWGNRSEATLAVTIDPWAVLSVQLVTDPAPPIARNVRFDQVVTITNTSARAASSPTVTVSLPAGTVYDAPVAAPASCSGISPGSGGTLVCTLGTIPASSTTTLRIPTRLVDRPASEQVTLGVVLASPDCADTDSTTAGSQCGSASTTVAVPRTPVAVSVSSSAASVAPSGSFRYFVDVTNGGPVRADVDLVMDLPPEAGMVGLGPLPGPASCTFTPALAGGSAGTPDVTTRCRFPLAAGATARFTVDAVALRVPATPALALVASASSLDCTPGTAPVAEPCGPSVAGGPTVTAAALRATYAQTLPAPGTNVRVGDTVRFRAGIRNDGPIAARQPQVQIQLPPELGMVGISQQPGVPFSCSFSPALGAQPTPRVLTSCGFQALAAGASVSFEIEARVLEVPVAPAAPVTVRVSSIDCADTSPSVAGVQCDTIAEGPGVVRTTLTPSVAMTPANPAVGDTVSIAFTTQNTGTVPARSLRTRLVLPAELAMTALTEFTGASSCSFNPPIAGGGTPAVTTTCAHPDLAPGGTNVVRVSAVVRSLPASGAFDVRGEVGSLDCRDLIAGDARRTCATALLPTPSTSLPASAGDLTLRSSTGTISSLQPIDSSLLPISPTGVAFPYGAMAFTVTDVPVGGSTEIFVGVTDVVAGYWKLTATGWSQYPSSQPVSGGMVFTLVDGGAGDADGIANGIIVDPGAVGVSNVEPSAPNRTVSTPVDTPVTVDVLTGASDSDGGLPEILDATDGASGRVAVATSDVTYTPEPEFTGEDTFTVRIGDGQGGVTTITVTVEVGQPGTPPPPPPVVPVGVADAYRATAGTALEVPARGVLANDQGADLSAELVEGPSVGSLTLRPDGSFTFLAPPATTARTVTFSYRPSGPSGIGWETTASIDVAPGGVVSKYAPQVSTRRDRGSPRALEGAIVSGPVAIFVPTSREIARVEWFLDDPAMTQRPRRVEYLPAYDFDGTAWDGRAQMFSTRLLADGAHVVTARVVKRDGGTEVVSSAFTVSNPRPATRVLSFSASPRRTEPRPLDGAVVTGPVAVFVPVEADIASVRFSVDGVLRSTERFAAYDLGTTNPNGTARLVTFTPGDHVVTARIEFDDGFVDTLTARFTVR